MIKNIMPPKLLPNGRSRTDRCKIVQLFDGNRRFWVVLAFGTAFAPARQNIGMLRHYFLYFIRNIKRQKAFSFIILLGLTVSLSSALLIYLYVDHEFSYDRFHEGADRIYRINQTFIWGDNSDHQFASTGPGVAYAIQQDVPEAELITSIHPPGNLILTYSSHSEVRAFEEDRVLVADTNFFRMFNFELVKGDRNTVLRHANTMVMTESAARKYFGDNDAIGKQVRITGSNNPDQTFEVTGVVKDLPDNSYFDFDILLSMKSIPIERLYWSWIWTQLETYVRFRGDANMEVVTERLRHIPRKHAEETLQRVMNTTFDEYVKSGKTWELFLQPLVEIHLPRETVFNRLNDASSRKTVYSLAGAGIVILILACVNFMNLSTAQFTRRVKEASVRRILGQGTAQLTTGFFAEALGFCVVALLGALAITQWILPAFNLVTGKTLTLNLFDGDLLIALAVAIVVMALASGAYPAWFLSHFHPSEGVKGKIKSGREGRSFRNGLVVFQFAVSIILMISTAVVFQQLQYVSEKDLGFRKENLIVLEHLNLLKNGESVREEVLGIPDVVEATRCSSAPPKIAGGEKFTAGVNDQTFSLNFLSTDEHFLETLQIKLVTGRNFYVGSQADSTRVILNETAVRTIGWDTDESVIGKKIRFPHNPDVAFEVIGIVSDFNYWTLDSPIEPLAIFHLANKYVRYNNEEKLVMRLRPQQAGWDAMFATLQNVWSKHAHDVPFEYSFVDEVFDRSFKSSERLAGVLTVLAGLAVIIASLGLLGMIMYALEQRMKEIGIRKVSGASTSNILLLISGSYAGLILISFLIAAPTAWWLMDLWLQDFPYRVTPAAGVFIGVGVATFILTILITSYHAWRAARMNPVLVLKDE